VLEIVLKLCPLEIVEEERDDPRLVPEMLVIDVEEVELDVVAIDVDEGLLDAEVDPELVGFTMGEVEVDETLPFDNDDVLAIELDPVE
jgi:predicted RNA methylase